MKTRTSTTNMNFIKNLETHIIDSIDFEGYPYQPMSKKEKLQSLKAVFYAEYKHGIIRYGHERALKEWIMGLPTVFTVAFQNYEILELGKAWNGLPQDATEDQEDKFIGRWFGLVARWTIQLMKRFNIDIKEEPQCNLTHDGKVKFTGTENECYVRLQGIQSSSASHAIQYEGWKVEPIV